jgi:hypothetical protein
VDRTEVVFPAACLVPLGDLQNSFGEAVDSLPRLVPCLDELDARNTREKFRARNATCDDRTPGGERFEDGQWISLPARTVKDCVR